MDGSQTPAPFRDARYAPARLDTERRPDGAIVLTNPTPWSDRFSTTLGPLDHWATQAPDRVWLAEREGEGWRTVTFAEARTRIAALAGALKGLGLTAGQPLLILARNGIDHALISYGAMAIGVPAAPVSPQYGLKGAELSRLQYACDVLKPAAVYTDDVEAFSGALDASFLAGLPVIASRNPRPDDIPFETALASPPAPFTAVPDDIAKLLLTSGSTGRPKAVICLHRNITLNGAQIAACFDDPDPPVVVNAAPWSHSLGANAILHMVLHRGGTLYIDAGQPVAGRFDETVRNLKEISPTYHNMVPAGWALFASALEKDEGLAATFFARVRVLQYGGASMAQSILDRVSAVAVRVTGQRITFATGYGSTETGPTACNIHWLNARSGMMGLPVPGASAKLVPVGEKYEMRVKGPQISPGYLGEPALSAAAFDEEGYYRLGDAARLVDEENPGAGLIFDGRLVENFKLASGTFVAAGALRVSAVSAIGGAVSDAVVCGEGEEGVGLMLFLDPAYNARHTPDETRAVIEAGLQKMNAEAKGGGGRIARALILTGAPDAASGELTDKGYINQALARSRRPEELARLFAAEPDAGVMSFT